MKTAQVVDLSPFLDGASLSASRRWQNESVARGGKDVRRGGRDGEYRSVARGVEE